MKTYNHLFEKLSSFENLQEAYNQARKYKTTSPKVKKFDEHWRLQLCLLMRELKTKKYQPKPLQTFILRDPKTRKICVSDFRDRIVHHALINILQPIFDPLFIYDSYASRINKGTAAAIKRFDFFLKKVSRNGTRLQVNDNANRVIGYVLKMDIKQYFESVDHDVLLEVISKKIKDDNVLWLIQKILSHYPSKNPGKGMPLGNWTSQFFANVYLNELDQFVKHKLKVKYYIRYVDDLVILDTRKERLEEHRTQITDFLKTIKLTVHPQKCKIIPLSKGVTFLGFRIFYHCKLLRQRNVRKIYTKFDELLLLYKEKRADADAIFNVFYGWSGYAQLGNTYRLRQRIFSHITREFEKTQKPL